MAFIDRPFWTEFSPTSRKNSKSATTIMEQLRQKSGMEPEPEPEEGLFRIWFEPDWKFMKLCQGLRLHWSWAFWLITLYNHNRKLGSFKTLFYQCILLRNVFVSQKALLGFYCDSFFYLSRNESPVSRVTPSHWEEESAGGRGTQEDWNTKNFLVASRFKPQPPEGQASASSIALCPLGRTIGS